MRCSSQISCSNQIKNSEVLQFLGQILNLFRLQTYSVYMPLKHSVLKEMVVMKFCRASHIRNACHFVAQRLICLDFNSICFFGEKLNPDIMCCDHLRS